MISLKYLILIGLISVLLFAGCITQPPTQTTQTPAQTNPEVCRNVTVQKPQVTENCGPVAFTETKCAVQKLQYKAIALPLIHICSTDGSCSGGQLSNCSSCTKAMTRCMMTIINLDSESSGYWTVGANYTVTGGQFIKDPQTVYIGPNETGLFDFNQFYTPGNPINSARCDIFVISDPSVQKCHDETRTRTECVNVTGTVLVTNEVCG